MSLRKLQVGIYGADGKLLSDVNTIVFDSIDEEPRNREKKVIVTLAKIADGYNNKDVELRIEGLVDGATTQKSTYIKQILRLHKSFESDFDE